MPDGTWPTRLTDQDHRAMAARTLRYEASFHHQDRSGYRLEADAKRRLLERAAQLEEMK